MNSTESLLIILIRLLEFDDCLKREKYSGNVSDVNSYLGMYLHNQILNKTVEKTRFSSI